MPYAVYNETSGALISIANSREGVADPLPEGLAVVQVSSPDFNKERWDETLRRFVPYTEEELDVINPGRVRARKRSEAISRGRKATNVNDKLNAILDLLELE